MALMGGLQDMDPDSKNGKEISSTLEVLDKLCAKQLWQGCFPNRAYFK
jgi:hypothetical protein